MHAWGIVHRLLMLTSVYGVALRRAMKYAPAELSEAERKEKFIKARKKFERAGSVPEIHKMPFHTRMRWALTCRLV